MATTKAFELGDLGTELAVNADGTITALDVDTDVVSEGSTNLYFTNARARGAISVSGNLTYDSGTGVLGFTMPTTISSLSNHDTDGLSEGTGNLYFTTARARASISGGTGITYSSSTGQVELTASGVTAGSYGSASAVPVVTVDTYGRITGVTTTAVAGVSSVSYDSNSEVLTINTSDGGTPSVDLSIGGSLNGPLDEITVKYLASAPSTPIQGQFYFDSLNQKMKVYTGSAWVDAVPSSVGGGGGDLTDAVATMEKFQYTTSSVTNAVSGSDDNGNTLSYVIDGSQNIEVFVNGIKQFEGASNDYVATTGSSVAFTYNLPSGSVVDIQVYELLSQDAFYLKTETYTQSEVNTQISTAVGAYVPLAGGTMTGDLTTTGLTVDTNTLHVDSVNNRVGIGATSPNSKLTVSAGSGGTILELNRSNTNTTGTVGAISFTASDGHVVSAINVVGDGDNEGGDIQFRTTSNASGTNYYTDTDVKMTIQSDGKVGIGTESPLQKLSINGRVSSDLNQDYYGAWFEGNTATSGDSFFAVGAWYSNSAHFEKRTGESYAHIYNYNGGHDLILQAGSGQSGRASATAGKVGIGTTSPQEKLEVNGVLQIRRDGDHPALRFAEINSGITTTRGYIASGDWAVNGGAIDDFGISSSVTGDLLLATNAGTERLRIQNSTGNVGIGTSSPEASLQVGGGTDQREYLTVNSLGGYYSGIKLARGAGDWSSLGNNNYGMLVTDGGFEISKFTSKGNNENGRTAYFKLDDDEVNVERVFGLARYSSDPTPTRAGQMYYNTTSSIIRVYDGSQWVAVYEPPFEATGGSKTTSGSYTIHTFTSSGTFTVTQGTSEVQYLVVAGGGGGGWAGPGGGGGGGYRSSVSGESSGGGASAETPLTLSSGSYTVTVGAGGSSSTNNSIPGSNGNNSVFASITSIGGGGGGSGDGTALPTSGGSGGGASYYDNGGSGTSGQGYRGGNSSAGGVSGGGGGAGSQGDDVSGGGGGNGGYGVSSSITGSTVSRAGGGGAYASGSGRDGGGSMGQSGAANRGGGGGGNNSGGSGGSGIVVIRYLTQ